MTFDEYQKKALTTDLFIDKPKDRAHNPGYVAKVLGLAGEAGEVAEKYKKIIRDKGGVVSKEDKTELQKELGDVLWYVAILCHYLDIPLEEVAKGNIAKLASRNKRGKLGGKGDNR